MPHAHKIELQPLSGIPPHMHSTLLRRERLIAFADEVQHFAHQTTTAHLSVIQELKRAPEGAPATTVLKSVSATLAEIADAARGLNDKRGLLVPNNPADSLKDFNDRTYEAVEHLYKLEAIVEVILDRAMKGRDEHLIPLCELCKEQFPKLRFALYGEKMGP